MYNVRKDCAIFVGKKVWRWALLTVDYGLVIFSSSLKACADQSKRVLINCLIWHSSDSVEWRYGINFIP
jgi:hypothetical protein